MFCTSDSNEQRIRAVKAGSLLVLFCCLFNSGKDWFLRSEMTRDVALNIAFTNIFQKKHHILREILCFKNFVYGSIISSVIRKKSKKKSSCPITCFWRFFKIGYFSICSFLLYHLVDDTYHDIPIGCGVGNAEIFRGLPWYVWVKAHIKKGGNYV